MQVNQNDNHEFFTYWMISKVGNQGDGCPKKDAAQDVCIGINWGEDN